jgi:membrane protein DedA with SNARE-associated domain
VAVLGVESWLSDLPPLLIYLVVGTVVLVESMGVPLPGEIVLISAALLSATGIGHPAGVAIGASGGAIIGDSIGYLIGRRGGRPLLTRVGRRFPRHFGPPQLARAVRIFARWGTWAVFFGRFIAILRILAGPMAGALHVPYRRFLVANAAGGIIWATGTTVGIYYAGVAAEHWLQRFSWIALVAAVVLGVGTTILVRHRTGHLAADEAPGHDGSIREGSTGGPSTQDTAGTQETGVTYLTVTRHGPGRRRASSDGVEVER